jgi:hypothetical protein
MRKTILCIALPVLVLAVAGCGGSSSSSSSSGQLSASDLKKQANAICEDLTSKTKNVDKTNDFDGALNATSDAITKLKALQPPDELKDKYQAFLDAIDAETPALTKLVKAIDKKDVATVNSLFPQVNAANKKADAAAAAAGLQACASD